jgi:hypothetical protein
MSESSFKKNIVSNFFQLRVKYNLLIKNVLNSKESIIVKNKRINFIKNTFKKTINNSINNYKNIIHRQIEFKKNDILNNKKIKKNALIIGINYNDTPYQLYGCINDANYLNDFLTSKGYTNTVLTDETSIKPDCSNILNNFISLLNNSKKGDTLFFSYSGHGTYTRDFDRNELTKNDQLIVPCDFNVILDDELKKIIQKYLKPNVNLIALFDSCFSQSVLDLKYQYKDSLNNDNNYINRQESITKGNVIMISGCSDVQTSADAFINGNFRGALTWAFLESINSEPNLSWNKLLIKMRELLKNNGYSQIPQLSSGKLININGKVIF